RFSHLFTPGVGAGFVAIALFFFAFTTMLAYYYYAETSVAYLWKARHPWIVQVLRGAFLLVVVYGTLHTAELAWAMGDIGVGLMAWLNIIAILLLSRPALACLRDYEEQLRRGTVPTYRASTSNIANTAHWR
ncbi:MAG TPA: alanine:cation symporter family protein, partial [Candidatus Synoicihabitans sp.]|nr:alanine:cation symporter family protein [Candidatus Synoicihabitans sp.]